MLYVSNSLAGVVYKQFRLSKQFASSAAAASGELRQENALPYKTQKSKSIFMNFSRGRAYLERLFPYWPWTTTNKERLIVAIADTQEKRKKRFDEVKAKVEDQDIAIRDKILALSLFQLRDSLQKDEFNSQTVLMAYAWKAIQVQESFNCVCEFLIESFKEAENLDKLYSGASSKPPLYGIPFSVKSGFYLKGYDCAAGLVNRLGYPKKADCSFVSCLRSLGAVPFVYTNVPQLLLSFVCSNPIFGTTVHPLNSLRTPGGTSGGEACLLAAGGTPFGIGNDLAGSMRIPANFCGLVSMKPTESRYLVDNAFSLPGRGRISLSNGFFSKSVDEQVFLWESTLAAPEDYVNAVPRNALKAPFRNDAFKETIAKNNLKIGYFSFDGFVKATPGCDRVLQETVIKLREQGHKLVQFRVPSLNSSASVLSRCLLPDSGLSLSKALNNDIVDPYLKEFALLLKIPFLARSLASYVLRYISPQTAIVFAGYVRTAENVIQAQAECDEYVKKFTSAWREHGFDAVICPAFPVPPVPHEYAGRLGALAFYTVLFNLLDYPAGVVPTGKVTARDDAELRNESNWPTGNNFLLKFMRDASANSEGFPLAVQVVTLPYQEEKCLGVMKIIENLWK